MAEPYLANIVGQFQQGLVFGGEQRRQQEAEQRQSRLSQLAQMAYGAQGDERRGLIGQAYGESPEFAAGLSKQLGSDDEAQQSMLLSTAKLIKAAPAEYKDAIFQRVRPQLSSQLPGLPLNYNDQVGQGIDAYLAAHGGDNLGDRYRVVGGSLIDLQADPTKPVFTSEPTRYVEGEDAVYRATPEGLRPLEILGGQSSQPAAPASDFSTLTAAVPGLRITSQQRSPEQNAAAGGVPTSFHLTGQAIDIGTPTPQQRAGINQWAQANGYEVIDNYQDGHVHLEPRGRPVQAPGFRPKGSADNEERLRLARDANRLANEAAEARRVEAENRAKFGTIPPGYRPNADRTALEPVPGAPAPASANPTVDEKTAATLLQRLAFSEQQLEQAVQEAPSAASPSIVAEVVRGLPFVGDVAANTVTPANRQRVEAAQLDILDAALTLGTGAAYTREQLEGYRKAYFPQIGDDPATIADKQARLKNVISAARIKAGRAAPAAGGGMGGGQGAPAAPPVGTVQGGYRFKGGNPADQANWEAL